MALPFFMPTYWGVGLWAKSFVTCYLDGILGKLKIIVMQIIH
jgi:hypothetical protein